MLKQFVIYLFLFVLLMSYSSLFGQVYFSDDFENGLDNWIVSGSDWDTISTTACNGDYCITDSPDGDYPDNANSIITLSDNLDLSTSSFPVLNFWHKYAIENRDSIYVEISIDEGWTWSELWSLGNYEFQSTWTQKQISLSEYNTSNQVKIRFRLRETSSGLGDGWYIDDVRIDEWDSGTELSLPFFDDFENGLDNWEISSQDWDTTSTKYCSPFHSITDSPDENYPNNANSIITLKGYTNISSYTSPELSFWHQYAIENRDSIFVEISTDGGWTWSKLWSLGNYEFQSTWTQKQISLSEYNTFNQVKIRFRLRETSSGLGDGWYIDDVEITGIPISSLSTNPTSLNFGDVIVNNSQDLQLTITNEGNVDVIITNISIDNNYFTINDPISFTLTPSESINKTVTFSPTEEGEQNGILSIPYTTPSEDDTLYVDLTGSGILPDIDVNPDTLNFGNVSINISENLTLTISNIGTGDLIISDITSNNSMFTVNNTNFIVPEGQDQQVTVTFLPTTAGEQNRILSIESNDPDESTVYVDLIGNCIVPDIDVIPLSINFGNILVGETNIENLTITNTGEGLLNVESITLSGDNADNFSIDTTPFSLEFNENNILEVGFEPDTTGNFEATIEIVSNDPDESSVVVNLSGTGIAPELSIEPDSINFGVTRVDSTSILQLTLSNIGSSLLSVNLISITGNDPENFSIDTTPFTIDVDNNTVLDISFTPTEIDTFTAVLEINSDGGNETIELSGEGGLPEIIIDTYLIDFGNLVIGENQTEQVSLTNLGNYELNVNPIEIIGTDSNSFIVDTSPFIIKPDSIKILEVTLLSDELGEKNADLIISSDDPVNAEITIELKANIREQDNTSPEITNINFPSEIIFGNQTSVTLSIEASDNIELISVICYYKGISFYTWNSEELTSSTGTYEITINDTIFDEIGVEYYFEAKDWLDNTTLSQRGITNWKYINDGLNFPALKFGNKVKNYQIISIPLNLDNTDIIVVLEDDLGAYNNQKWRLFNYQNNENIELGLDLMDFEIGRSYWLIIKDSVNVDTGPGTTISMKSDSSFAINLSQGWNQIGNPYNFDLSWSQIKDFNDNDPRIGLFKIFDESFQQSDNFKKFGGGFVFVDEDLDLKIPPLKSGKNYRGQYTNNSLNWEVKLYIESGYMSNNLSGFGMHSNASLSKDEFDDMTLPRFMEYLEINFYHPDYFYPKFTKDIVPTCENYIWEFTVESNLEENNFELNWELFNIKNSKELVLFDTENQRCIDMISKNNYRYDSQENRNFRVYYGSSDFINENLVPEKIILSQNYPNPFNLSQTGKNHGTIISFTIPDKSEQIDVILEIFNIKGQLVKTLIKSKYSKGFYDVIWDGSDNNDQKVSTGVYFYNLQMKDKNKIIFNRSKKMILIK